MDPILNEFRDDTEKTIRLLKLTSLLYRSQERGIQLDDEVCDPHIRELLDSITYCHPMLPVLPGTILLYLIGRFEYFIKTEFENLCGTIIGKCQKFCELPKSMRTELIALTAEIMKSPRKYGHAEQGVRSFVIGLASSLNAESGLTDINTSCLSITNENMRHVVLADLFKRASYADIWKDIGQQAKIRSFWETTDPAHATKQSTVYLDELMSIRNSIAHPSGSVSWPSVDKVTQYCSFLLTLGEAVADLCVAHATAFRVSLEGP